MSVDTSPFQNPPPLSWLTPPRLLLGLAGLGLVVMLAGTCLLYQTGDPLPPPRDPPPLPTQTAITDYRFKEAFYTSIVQEDAKKLQLQAPTLAQLKAVNRLSGEFAGNQRLTAGDKLETKHLVLKTENRKLWVGDEGQGYRTTHLVLSITNKTDKHLAYRVQTRVTGRCAQKGILPHNALALRPREELARTECLANGAGPLRITEVEVLELSPLAYHYVSRLDPLRLQLDRRAAEGHAVEGGLPACRLLPWQIIQTDLQRGAGWHDVADFYSRHSCDEYSFYLGYRHLQQPPETLPLRGKAG